VDHGQDVAPRSQAEEKARAEGERRPPDRLVDPARAEPQGPGPEGQHLDVVPVVAEAVLGHERGGEGRIEPGGQRGPGPRAPPGQPVDGGHEQRVEEHRDEAEGPGRLEDQGKGRREVGLQASAIGHVRDEHQPLDPLPDPDGHDPRQRAVGRRVPSGALERQGQPEQDGKPHDQEETGAIALVVGAKIGGAAPDPEAEEPQRRQGQEQRGARVEPARTESSPDVEPTQTKQDPEERRAGAGHRGEPPSRALAGHQAGKDTRGMVDTETLSVAGFTVFSKSQ
jgi:hypothetical protein